MFHSPFLKSFPMSAGIRNLFLRVASIKTIALLKPQGHCHIGIFQTYVSLVHIASRNFWLLLHLTSQKFSYNGKLRLGSFSWFFPVLEKEFLFNISKSLKKSNSLERSGQSCFINSIIIMSWRARCLASSGIHQQGPMT